MKAAEDLVKSKQTHSDEHSTKSWGESPIAKTKFATARSNVENQDPVLMLVNEPTSDMFATNEVDESTFVPVFDRRSDSSKYKKVSRDQETIVPTHEKGMQSFLGALNYYSRFIQDFAVFGAGLYQLKDDDFENDSYLTMARRSFDMLKQK
ncbi:hypothetical protein PHMEG_00036033, partial [Phytophthora megakarya]